MSVQNNSQPNFGMKVLINSKTAENVVRKGRQGEMRAVKTWAESTFAKDPGEFTITSDKVDIRHSIKSFVARRRAEASLPRHIANLTNKYGVKIEGSGSLLNEPLDGRLQSLFLSMTNIAKELAQVPHKEKYKIAIFSGNGHPVQLSRGRSLGWLPVGIAKFNDPLPNYEVAKTVDDIQKDRSLTAGWILQKRREYKLSEIAHAFSNEFNA